VTWLPLSLLDPILQVEAGDLSGEQPQLPCRPKHGEMSSIKTNLFIQATSVSWAKGERGWVMKLLSSVPGPSLALSKSHHLASVVQFDVMFPSPNPSSILPSYCGISFPGGMLNHPAASSSLPPIDTTWSECGVHALSCQYVSRI